MLEFYKLKLRLLTPLFYWSKISAGAVFTDEFIGDMSLYYAINRVFKLQDFSSSFYGKFNPNYEEIKRLPFWISVARPIRIKQTDIYAHKTEFSAEVNNRSGKINELAGKSPFKGYFKQQGIEALSEFETIYYGDRNLIPNALRIGTHLHTLVEIEEKTRVSNECEIWINLYSWQEIFKQKINLDDGLIEYKLPIYMIYKSKLNQSIKDGIFATKN